MKKKISHQISIAVLPFRNLSGDQQQEYLSDGMTEEIIFALTKIEQLQVVSRTSSFYFKDHELPVTNIGKQLGVDVILMGSVRTNGDSLRISIQLVQVEGNHYLWSEIWERPLGNLFAVQEEISLAVADKLREHLGHLVIADQLVEYATDNLTAYRHYLKGRHHYYRWNPEDMNRAIQEFERAITLDPRLLPAYLGLADAYSFLAVAGFAPRELAWNKAIAALDTAGTINANDAGLNYLLAFRAFFTEADFATALQLVLKSLATNPAYTPAHLLATFLYTLNGSFRQAEQHLFYAKSVDPLNPETRFYTANFHYRTGDYAKARVILDELLQENELNLPALIVTIYLKILNGEGEAARQQIASVHQELITPDEKLGLHCLIAIVDGKMDSDELTTLREHALEPTAHHAHAYLFIAYARSARYDLAYDTLDKLFLHQSSILLLAFSDPLAEKIRSTARYQQYFSRVYPQVKTIKSTRQSLPPVSDQAATEAEMERLEQVMINEQPYLNPALSLRTLAGQVAVHPNHLSWLLNQRIGKNFNEYINQHRIQHFKALVTDPVNNHISLLGLAYESGFNSKTVFNTAFKKQEGMTPSAFQKSSIGSRQ